MRKLARLCKRLKRCYGLHFVVNRVHRRYYVYFFDSLRSNFFLDGWFDSLPDVENFLLSKVMEV